MNLISTLSTYLRYSACLLIFIGLTACGDDEAATGEASSTNPSSSGEPSSTTGALAAPGSSCSCDDDCASVKGHTGVCYVGICMVDSDPVDTCDEEGTTANCPTGFKCWSKVCLPDCDSYDCDDFGGTCTIEGSCQATPPPGPWCDSSCSRHCSAG